jgi:hypothetical protein
MLGNTGLVRGRALSRGAEILRASKLGAVSSESGRSLSCDLLPTFRAGYRRDYVLKVPCAASALKVPIYSRAAIIIFIPTRIGSARISFSPEGRVPGLRACNTEIPSREARGDWVFGGILLWSAEWCWCKWWRSQPRVSDTVALGVISSRLIRLTCRWKTGLISRRTLVAGAS